MPPSWSKAAACRRMFVGGATNVPSRGAKSTTLGRWFVIWTTTGKESALPNPSSVARAINEWIPGGGLFQRTVNGAEPAAPMLSPSAKNSTRRTVPSPSVAIAAIVRGVPAEEPAPEAGAVRVTKGSAFVRFGAPAETPAAYQLVG